MKVKRARSIERAITAEIFAIKVEIQKLEDERGPMDGDLELLNAEVRNKRNELDEIGNSIRRLEAEAIEKDNERFSALARYDDKLKRRGAIVAEQSKLAAKLMELESSDKLMIAREKLASLEAPPEVVPPATDGEVVSPIKLKIPAKLPRRSFGKNLSMASGKVKKQILRGRP